MDSNLAIRLFSSKRTESTNDISDYSTIKFAELKNNMNNREPRNNVRRNLNYLGTLPEANKNDGKVFQKQGRFESMMIICQFYYKLN